MTDAMPYAVPDWKMDDLRARIDALNKTAAKLGCAKVVLTIIGDHIKEIFPHRAYDEYGEKIAPKMVLFIDVTLTGEAPKLNGWSFLGTLQHLGDANILRALPGVTIPESYRLRPNQCDHCHTVRQRTDTYVVQHEDGRTRQVGTSCLKDFLGHSDPATIANFCSNLGDLFNEFGGGGEYDDDDFDRCPRDAEYFQMDRYLSYVVAAVRNFGWVSSTTAREYGKESTKNFALTAMTERDQAKLKDAAIPTDAHRAEAAAAIAWMKSIDGTWTQGDAYKENLHTLFTAREYLTYRDLGLAALLIPCYEREVERRITEKQAKAESHHVGTIKARMTFTDLLVTRIFTTEPGEWGSTYICGFVDADGNQLTWFASTCPAFDAGDTVSLNATVKDHSTYHDIPQTIITRATVLSVTPAGDPEAVPGGGCVTRDHTRRW